jgi:hypothetical protein
MVNKHSWIQQRDRRNKSRHQCVVTLVEAHYFESLMITTNFTLED